MKIKKDLLLLIISLAIAFILGFMFVAGCDNPQQSKLTETTSDNQTHPVIRYAMIDNMYQEFDSIDYNGRDSTLRFWKDGCGIAIPGVVIPVNKLNIY